MSIHAERKPRATVRVNAKLARPPTGWRDSEGNELWVQSVLLAVQDNTSVKGGS